MRGPSIAIPPSRALAQFALGALLAALAQCAFAAAPSADPPSGEADWQSLMDGASRAFGDGRLEEAENSVRRALAMAEEFPALDPRRIRSLDGLAQVLFRQGQQAEQEAQDLIASQSGEAAAIRDMEQRAESKFGEAETLLEQAIDLRQQTLGAGNPELASALSEAANMLRDMGRPDKASLLYEQIAAIYDAHGRTMLRAAGETDREARDRSARGDSGGQDDRWQWRNPPAWADIRMLAALGLLVAAVVATQLGKWALDWLWRRRRRAGMDAFLEGRSQDAERLHRKAYELARLFGPCNVRVGESQSNLAILYLFLGQLDKADKASERALAIMERHLGPGHPDLARHLADRAEILRRLDRLDEAGALESRAKEIKSSHG